MNPKFNPNAISWSPAIAGGLSGFRPFIRGREEETFDFNVRCGKSENQRVRLGGLRLGFIRLACVSASCQHYGVVGANRRFKKSTSDSFCGFFFFF